MSNQNFSLTWSVFEEDSGSLLREFLSKCDISKRALTDIKFKGGYIQLNGVEVTVRERIETGDTVTVIFPPEQGSEGLLPEPIPLNVRYEDEFVLVVAKPPSMNTIPPGSIPTAVWPMAWQVIIKRRGYGQRSILLQGLTATHRVWF